MEPTETVSASRALEALMVAQSMEDAVRNIVRPLEEIAEAFPIVQAVHACLDKQAGAVDPLIEVMQRDEDQRSSAALRAVLARADGNMGPAKDEGGTSKVGQAIPNDLAHRINSELLDAITLMRVAAGEVPSGGDEVDTDPDRLTSASSRTQSLIFMAEDKVRAVLRDLEPYA